MARSLGYVLAAGGIALANELVFSPPTQTERVNWRLIPATAVLAAALAGLEKGAPGFAVGLAGLVLLSVLVLPTGKAKPFLENVADLVVP